MLIEKGLDAQSIKEFFESKSDPYRLIKIGVISSWVWIRFRIRYDATRYYR